MTLVASTTQYLSCILLQSKHPLPLLFCVKKSPLTVVQQFLSRVIRDGSWPLPLPSDLLENALQQALTTSASLYMRWELRLEGWDYQLLSLPFIPAAQAKKIVEMFLASPICCLPQGFSKKIFQIVKKTEISAAKNLLGPYWWQIFSIIAHRLTLSTLDVEATHSRHRHLCRSSHSTSIETLVCRSLSSGSFVGDERSTRTFCKEQGSQSARRKRREEAYVWEAAVSLPSSSSCTSMQVVH